MSRLRTITRETEPLSAWRFSRLTEGEPGALADIKFANTSFEVTAARHVLSPVGTTPDTFDNASGISASVSGESGSMPGADIANMAPMFIAAMAPQACVLPARGARSRRIHASYTHCRTDTD